MNIIRISSHKELFDYIKQDAITLDNDINLRFSQSPIKNEELLNQKLINCLVLAGIQDGEFFVGNKFLPGVVISNVEYFLDNGNSKSARPRNLILIVKGGMNKRDRDGYKKIDGLIVPIPISAINH